MENKSSNGLFSRRHLLTGGVAVLGLAAGYNGLVKAGFADTPPKPTSIPVNQDTPTPRALSQDLQRIGNTGPDTTQETSLSEYIAESNDAEFKSIEGDVLKFRNQIAAEQFEPMQLGGLFDHSHDADRKKQKPPAKEYTRWFDALNMDQSMRLIENTIGIPVSLQKEIVFLESKNDQNATNPDTHACGLKQLMPDTTYPEMLYKYGSMLGYDDLADKVEKYVFAKDKEHNPIYNYRIKHGQYAAVMPECYNVWINLSLGSFNLVEKMRRTEDKMAHKYGYKLNNYTQADLYIAHFLGARPDIMLAYRLHPEKKARSFVNSEVARQNYGMFYKPDGKERSVAELYRHIDDMGPSATIKVTSFWRTKTDTIDQRMTVAMNTLSPK